MSILKRLTPSRVLGPDPLTLVSSPADQGSPFLAASGWRSSFISEFISRKCRPWYGRECTENAVFTRSLIAPKPGERWLLVTSALHMPREIGAFRQAGFPIEAYPVDYQTDGWEDLLNVFRFAHGQASAGLIKQSTNGWAYLRIG